MNRLLNAYGDTVNLCILSESEVIYLEIMEGTYALRMSDRVGSKGPFHATATGKVLASHLSKDKIKKMVEVKGLQAYTQNTIQEEDKLLHELALIRSRGFAVDLEENVEGARCIAAPIYNMFGSVEGAISLSGARHRFPEDKLESMAQDIMAAARNISKKMGCS